MANILIVGFEKTRAEELRDQIDMIIEQNGWAVEGESATVILDVQTRWCGNKKPAPYLIVQHSKADMAEKIGTAVHTALNLDTQIEVTYKYLAEKRRYK
jgi:transcription elongation factor GreA-like protein